MYDIHRKKIQDSKLTYTTSIVSEFEGEPRLHVSSEMCQARFQTIRFLEELEKQLIHHKYNLNIVATIPQSFFDYMKDYIVESELDIISYSSGDNCMYCKYKSSYDYVQVTVKPAGGISGG